MGPGSSRVAHAANKESAARHTLRSATVRPIFRRFHCIALYGIESPSLDKASYLYGDSRAAYLFSPEPPRLGKNQSRFDQSKT